MVERRAFLRLGAVGVLRDLLAAMLLDAVQANLRDTSRFHAGMYCISIGTSVCRCLLREVDHVRSHGCFRGTAAPAPCLERKGQTAAPVASLDRTSACTRRWSSQDHQRTRASFFGPQLRPVLKLNAAMRIPTRGRPRFQSIPRKQRRALRRQRGATPTQATPGS